MWNTNRVFSATTEKEDISSHGERLSEFIWLTCVKERASVRISLAFESKKGLILLNWLKTSPL